MRTSGDPGRGKRAAGRRAFTATPWRPRHPRSASRWAGRPGLVAPPTGFDDPAQRDRPRGPGAGPLALCRATTRASRGGRLGRVPPLRTLPAQHRFGHLTTQVKSATSARAPACAGQRCAPGRRGLTELVWCRRQRLAPGCLVGVFRSIGHVPGIPGPRDVQRGPGDGRRCCRARRLRGRGTSRV